MKIAVRIAQVIVGLLFIVSGLVKANDPIGLGYKMQEFFELWSSGFALESFVAKLLAVLHDASLGLSIAMITLEILAGVALLLGWQKKAVLWLLLALIVFFTFLTGYAYLSGKFTNCGCFGDCLPITPLTSFVKDLLLLGLILFVLYGQRYIQSFLSPRGSAIALSTAFLFSLGLQWFVLNNLPLVDCLPFKRGNYLPAQMKPPPGAVPDSFAIRFVYEKAGKQYEFSPENLPDDYSTYTFIARKQSLDRKGTADAAIKGFTLTNGEKDEMTGNAINFADTLLQQPKALLLFALEVKNTGWIRETKAVIANAREAGIPVGVVSSNFEQAQNAFAAQNIQGVRFYNTDFTVVRTVARTNPTVLLLENGTVVKKWSRNALADASAYLTNLKN